MRIYAKQETVIKTANTHQVYCFVLAFTKKTDRKCDQLKITICYMLIKSHTKF